MMASLLQISSLFLLVYLAFSHICSSRKLDLGTEETKVFPLLPSKDSASLSGFDSSNSIQLSWNPRVFLYEGFISDEECDHLLSLANGKLDKPLAANNNTGDGDSSVVNLHNGFELARGRDEIISRIEERISAWTFLPNENGEGMQILHHRVNEGSEPLYQYNQDNNLENVIGGPRIATILIFLSNIPNGGEIIFPKSKIKDYNTRNEKEMWSECASSGFAVKHVKNNALLIFNLHPNATVDESSVHGGCSVLEGEKWSAIKWIHVRAFDRKELSLSSDSEEECTDEDNNCPQWAAMGECQRNSVFMLGSPDYYGSCRKSCGVC